MLMSVQLTTNEIRLTAPIMYVRLLPPKSQYVQWIELFVLWSTMVLILITLLSSTLPPEQYVKLLQNDPIRTFSKLYATRVITLFV
jgi:hypothetical protein